MDTVPASKDAALETAMPVVSLGRPCLFVYPVAACRLLARSSDSTSIWWFEEESELEEFSKGHPFGN